MNLQSFLDMLTEVELSQNSFGSKDDSGELLKKFELINLINRGLENIHSRFILNKGELILKVDSSIRGRHDIRDENYILSPDTSRSVFKILEVWDNCGNKLNLNTIHRSLNNNYYKEPSVQMINKTNLIFDNCCGLYRILYHAGPILIKKPEEDETLIPSEVELDIPFEFVDALIYYVASRLFSIIQPMEGNAASFSPGIVYSKRFEEECLRLKLLNLEIEGVGDSSQRFNDSMFP